MKRIFKFLKSSTLMPIAALIFGLFAVQTGYGQYCYPQHGSSCSGTDEFIDEVMINNIDNSTACGLKSNGYPGYSDYTAIITTLYRGKSYDVFVHNGIAFPSDQVTVWIDFNNNYSFTDKGEEFTLSSTDKGVSFTGTVKIAADAPVGTKRMRVMMCYNTTPESCTGNTYGETEDYTVILRDPPADALVSAMTSPVKPFPSGVYPVTGTLMNKGETILTSCDIDWSVNNVYQGTYHWTGSLKQNSTASITFGSYDFTYPAVSNFSPFLVKFTTKNANNDPPDLDPSNDIYSIQTAPILNDCGVTGVFGPAEGFGPGITQVRAKIKNYAPKPLSSVTVNWKIDGVTQTPKTITGLNIKSMEEQDVVIGTYNFYNKTPLGPFAVEAYTTLPNGVTDEAQSNDKYTGGMGPSLVAGTYNVGGANAHFPTLTDAVSYLNSSGVFGTGTVTLSIRPGTYDGQLVMNNPLPYHNSIVFTSSTGNRYDVNITASPTIYSNYVMKFSGVDNVVLHDISVTNKNNNSSGAGCVIAATGINSLNIMNSNINGVQNAPKKDMNYAGFYAENSTGIVISGVTFNYGSYSFDNNTNNGMPPSLVITGCDFEDFTSLGILNMITSASGNNVTITNNMFHNNGGITPNGAIESHNATIISGNTFTGITGSGSLNDALIAVYHSAPDMNNQAVISNNTIANCFDINGILVSNAYSVISRNNITMNQSANFGFSAIKLIGAEGAAGDNMIFPGAIEAFDAASSDNFDIIYNTVNASNATAPILNLSGVGMVERNIFMNTGNGPVYKIGSAAKIDQNTIYTTGSVALNGAAPVGSMANWQAMGYDQNSHLAQVTFANVNDLHIKTYIPEILYNTPLFTSSAPTQFSLENSDYDNEVRTSWYSGADEIFLTIILERQSPGIVDCLGSTTNVLSASTKINYDAVMSYQWDKDGVNIPGANKATLPFTNLQFKQRGQYRCKITGPGTTADVYTDYVSVYVLTGTDITQQPTDATAIVGDVAKFFFRAHVNGVEIEDAILTNDVQIQWFKVGAGGKDITLNDKQDKIAGANSNYLTINNFKTADEASFYARITGKCGVSYTDTVSLSEDKNDLAITTQPLNVQACAGTDGAAFQCVAATSGNKTIEFQWYKNGYPVLENSPKVTGTKTGTLTVNNADLADAGTYYATAKLSGSSVSERSANAELTIINKPVITQDLSDVSVKTGSNLSLVIKAAGNSAEEVLTYAWYKDGAVITGADKDTYSVTGATNTDAGAYWCTVSNTCGATESKHTNVAITTETTEVQDVSSNGYSLSGAVPNPVNGNAVIDFFLPNTENVKIILSNINGTELATLTDKQYPAGTSSVTINSYSLNLPSGVYYYTLESGKVRLVHKMIVVK